MAPINPCYFGLPGRRLFGVHHPPAGAAQHETCVVLCPPIGDEYVRSHRAFAMLASLLSSAGFAVLRFDYHGTGDSSGDPTSGHLEQWVEDVGTAIEEVRGRSGAEKVCAVGLRLGAAIVLLASESHPEMSAAVLWDPVVRGREYLREIESAHKEWFTGSFARERPTSAPGVALEVMGFPISVQLHKGLQDLDLLELTNGPPRILLCSSEDASRDQRIGQLGDGLMERDALDRLRVERVWTKYGDVLDQPLVPYRTLKDVAAWILKSVS